MLARGSAPTNIPRETGLAACLGGANEAVRKGADFDIKLLRKIGPAIDHANPREGRKAQFNEEVGERLVIGSGC